MRPLFISVPHAGEQVPPETPWLKNLPEPLLMFDVDRYVDKLYRPAVEKLKIPFVVASWHRYVVDLNRLPEDIDEESVEGAPHPKGTFTRGFHWVKTTADVTLMNSPISFRLHEQLVEKYFLPFHRQIEEMYRQWKLKGIKKNYHLDVHSMPSQGLASHRDAGEERSQVVVSDYHGKSCDAWFCDLVIESYRQAGFKVSVNWPYIGGRLTQTYGRPDQGQNVVQVELNRALYMDETTKRLKEEKSTQVQLQLERAITTIFQNIPEVYS